MRKYDYLPSINAANTYAMLNKTPGTEGADGEEEQVWDVHYNTVVCRTPFHKEWPNTISVRAGKAKAGQKCLRILIREDDVLSIQHYSQNAPQKLLSFGVLMTIDEFLSMLDATFVREWQSAHFNPSPNIRDIWTHLLKGVPNNASVAA